MMGGSPPLDGSPDGRVSPARQPEIRSFQGLPPDIFPLVCEQVEVGLEWCLQFSNFWKEVGTVEEEAARKITKLCQSAEANLSASSMFKKKVEAVCNSSLKATWFETKRQVEALANARLDLAKSIRQMVSQPLQQFSAGQTKRLKQISLEGRTVTSVTRKAFESLLKTQQEYYDARKSSIKSSNEYFKFVSKYTDVLGKDAGKIASVRAVKDGDTARKEVKDAKDLEVKARKLEEKAESCRKTARATMKHYYATVKNTKREREGFLTSIAPQCFAQLEDIESKRYGLFRETWKELLKVLREVPGHFLEASQSVEKSLDELSCQKDSDDFSNTVEERAAARTFWTDMPNYHPFDGKSTHFYQNLEEQARESCVEQKMYRQSLDPSNKEESDDEEPSGTLYPTMPNPSSTNSLPEAEDQANEAQPGGNPEANRKSPTPEPEKKNGLKNPFGRFKSLTAKKEVNISNAEGASLHAAADAPSPEEQAASQPIPVGPASRPTRPASTPVGSGGGTTPVGTPGTPSRSPAASLVRHPPSIIPPSRNSPPQPRKQYVGRPRPGAPAATPPSGSPNTPSASGPAQLPPPQVPPEEPAPPPAARGPPPQQHPPTGPGDLGELSMPHFSVPLSVEGAHLDPPAPSPRPDGDGPHPPPGTLDLVANGTLHSTADRLSPELSAGGSAASPQPHSPSSAGPHSPFSESESTEVSKAAREGADATELVEMCELLQSSARDFDYFSLFGIEVGPGTPFPDARSVGMQAVTKQRRSLTSSLHPDRQASDKEKELATAKLAKINQVYTQVFKVAGPREVYYSLCDLRRDYPSWMHFEPEALQEVAKQLLKMKKQVKRQNMPIELLTEVQQALQLASTILSLGE